MNAKARIAELEQRVAELTKDRDAWREMALKAQPQVPILATACCAARTSTGSSSGAVLA